MSKFKIAGQRIKPGTRTKIDIGFAKLHDFTYMSIPVEVIRGKKEGPILFVSAAIHGDEINGTEIIKRLLMHPSLENITGTLIAVPIVNVFGFNTRSRYLPDRRDLNRSFPGRKKGSLTAQLAYSFTKEIISKCTHGIDLHTAAIHNYNLPHIRVSFDGEEKDNEEAFRLAHAFQAPVILNSKVIDGSLRKAAKKYNIPILLFEGGEALRFDEDVIQSALNGILSVMQAIGMCKPLKKTPKANMVKCFIAGSSHRLRAPSGGIFIAKKKIGDKVLKDELLGFVSDPFGTQAIELRATYSGIIIGINLIPLVNSGDSIFHIATFKDLGSVKASIDAHKNYHEAIMH